MRALIIAIALTAPSVALAAPSIVGQWAYKDGSCGKPTDTISVEQMGMQWGDDQFCSFKSVKREGSVVTWTGAHCVTPSGETVIKAATATAIDGPNGLTIRFGKDSVNGPFKSCSRRAR